MTERMGVRGMSEIERTRPRKRENWGQERGEKVPNTRNTRATYFCKSGFIRKARVVRRDVELPELPILYKKTFKTNTYTLYTRTHLRTLRAAMRGNVYM